ncbi:MAG TPA: hypothetical protein PKN22_10710, partial [Taishania sp.]|nr:hypothetical protein [Taishania sp.]
MKFNKTSRTFLIGLLLTSFITINNCQAQIQKGLDIDGEAAEDYSGWTVSMPDVNTVAIGAPLNDATGSNAGQVRVYSWNGSAWAQKGLDIDGEAIDDQFGSAISMPNANTVAIGANGNDGTGSSAGHVRVYSWNGTAWTQKGLDIDGEAAGDQSGFSVSMPDENTVAIGALFNDGSATNAGHVRIYSWNGTAWVQKGLDIDGEAANDQSGYSISMPDANTVAIGAIYNSGAGFEFGHTRIYSWNGTAWVQKGLDIDGEAANDRSGWSVSMGDANTVAISARYNDGNGSNSGHVRVYSWNGTTWTQQGMDINGEVAGDHSGWSVSMANANTLAISAIYNDGNGTDAGHTRIYSWNGSAWMQKGMDIDGEVAGDMSGYCVSMGDANTVAIGARFNDGSATNAGHVRVFSMCTATTGTDTQTACGSFTWIDGNTYTANNNTATHTIVGGAANGCDSIVTLNLTINNPTTGTDTQTACGSFTWIDGNTYTSSNNTATHTIVGGAANGCDSIVTLNLTINNST